MNGLDGELLVALSEIPLPDGIGDQVFAHVAVTIAMLARNPGYAAKFGQALTEHTGPAEPPPPRPLQLADHRFEGPGPACTHRPGRLGSCGRPRGEHPSG